MGCSSSRATTAEVTVPVKPADELYLEMVNSLVEDQFQVAKHVVEMLEKKPLSVDESYTLARVSGGLTNPPRVLGLSHETSSIYGHLSSSVTAINLDVEYITTDLALRMKLISKSWLKPGVTFDIKSVKVQAKIRAIVSLSLGVVKFWLIEKPTIEWDLEIEVTDLGIDVIGEAYIAKVRTGGHPCPFPRACSRGLLLGADSVTCAREH